MPNNDGWKDIPIEDEWKDIPPNSGWKDIPVVEPPTHSLKMDDAEPTFSNIKTGLLGAAQGMVGNWGDEAAGAIKAFGAKITGDKRPIKDIYREKQQQLENYFSSAQKQNPIPYNSGNAVGAVFSPINKLVPGGLKGVLAANAISSAGASKGNLDNPNNAESLATDTGFGTLIGGLTHGAIKGANSIAQNATTYPYGQLAEKLSEKAAVDRAQPLSFGPLSKMAGMAGAMYHGTPDLKSLIVGGTIAVGSAATKKYGSTVAATAAKSADYFARKIPPQLNNAIGSSMEMSPEVSRGYQEYMKSLLNK